ncbi:MAG: hypothetical protein R6T91_00475, partial [Bacteroidales bacterium]
AVASPRPLTGVAHVPRQAMITVLGSADPAELAGALVAAGVGVDMMGPGSPGDGSLSFAVDAEEASSARRALGSLGWGEGEVLASLGKVSLVGNALRADPETAGRVPEVLVGAGLGVAALWAPFA